MHVNQVPTNVTSKGITNQSLYKYMPARFEYKPISIQIFFSCFCILSIAYLLYISLICDPINTVGIQYKCQLVQILNAIGITVTFVHYSNGKIQNGIQNHSKTKLFVWNLNSSTLINFECYVFGMFVYFTLDTFHMCSRTFSANPNQQDKSWHQSYLLSYKIIMVFS